MSFGSRAAHTFRCVRTRAVNRPTLALSSHRSACATLSVGCRIPNSINTTGIHNAKPLEYSQMNASLQTIRNVSGSTAQLNQNQSSNVSDEVEEAGEEEEGEGDGADEPANVGSMAVHDIDEDAEFEELTIEEVSSQMLEQAREQDGTKFTPFHPSEYEYQPLPRMPGPSPFVERRYKNKKPFHHYGRLRLPLSVTHPLPPPSLPRFFVDEEAQQRELEVFGEDKNAQKLRSNGENRLQMWIHNSNGDKLSMIKVPSDVFGQNGVRMDILFTCLRWEKLMKKGFTWNIVRMRGEVRGTCRKKRKQKGTARARMSDGRAPPFAGGGKAHGRRPRDHSINLPKDVWYLGFKHALTARYNEGDLILWEDFVLPRLRIPNVNGSRMRAGLKDKESRLDWNRIDKLPELQNLTPVEYLDWHESTRLYQDVERTRQMLRNWGWLKPTLNEIIHDRHSATLFAEASHCGNIIDMLEALPIARFGWEFLKENDQSKDATIPSVLMIYAGEYLNHDFKLAMDRVSGVDLVRAEDLFWKDGSGMTVNKLLTYKKIVLSMNAYQFFMNELSVENSIKRQNYWAEINCIEAEADLAPAFPAEIYGEQEIPDEMFSTMRLH